MSNALALKSENQKSPSLFPSESEWSMLKEQASLAVKSKLLPSAVDSPEKAIAIALKGRELGIPPMHAFSHIHIVQGKPTISAELMLSLIYKNCPGAVINYIENTPKTCVIEVKRPGGKPTKFSYTIEEARDAQLLSKDSWKKYPAAMLRARAISIAARAVFPDAIMGCSYVPEELGAVVNDEGQVIEIPKSAERPPVVGQSYVRPEQPDSGDGNTEPSGYRIGFGKWTGKSLEQVYREFGPKAIAERIAYLESDKYTNSYGALRDVHHEFINLAEKFLGAMESAPVGETVDDLPFGKPGRGG